MTISSLACWGSCLVLQAPDALQTTHTHTHTQREGSLTPLSCCSHYMPSYQLHRSHSPTPPSAPTDLTHTPSHTGSHPQIMHTPAADKHTHTSSTCGFSGISLSCSPPTESNTTHTLWQTVQTDSRTTITEAISLHPHSPVTSSEDVLQHTSKALPSPEQTHDSLTSLLPPFDDEAEVSLLLPSQDLKRASLLRNISAYPPSTSHYILKQILGNQFDLFSGNNRHCLTSVQNLSLSLSLPNMVTTSQTAG